MTKKEISTYLRKWFGYMPSAREIVFFELYQEPKKEKDFTREDKENTFLELQRQFPDQYKDKPKRPKSINVYIPEYKSIIERVEEPQETGVQRVMRRQHEESIERSFKTARQRAQEVKRWHEQHNITIPDEMKQLFAKYDIQ